MAMKTKAGNSLCLVFGVLFLIPQASYICGSVQAEGHINKQASNLQTEPDFPWLEMGNNWAISSWNGTFLSRDRRAANGTRRSRTVWQKIEDFYADKNNMAMFCVLPVLILIYGGCSSIYCIYKFRLYLKRRKHKRLKEEEDQSSTNTTINKTNKDNCEQYNIDMHRPVSRISSAWTDTQVGTGETKPFGQTKVKNENSRASPKTWQNENMSRASYIDDCLREDQILMKERRKGPALRLASTTAECVNPRSTGRVRHKSANQKDVQATTEFLGVPERDRNNLNMSDYSIRRPSIVKAADNSGLSENRNISIIPLTEEPNLRAWDPLHNRAFFGESGYGSNYDLSSFGVPIEKKGAVTRSENSLAKYDALSTLHMTKKDAEMLNTEPMEMSQNQRKQLKKKYIFVTD